MDDEAFYVIGPEHQIGAEGDTAAGNLDLPAFFPVAADEMAGFVELPVVRQMDFRHDAEDMAAMDGDGAVIQRALVAKRRADQQQRQERGGARDDRTDGGFDRIQHRGLLQQVADRIAGHAKLREHRQRDRASVAVLRHAQDGARVRLGIGERGTRGAGGNAGEAVAVEGPEAHARHYRAGWAGALPGTVRWGLAG